MITGCFLVVRMLLDALDTFRHADATRMLKHPALDLNGCTPASSCMGVGAKKEGKKESIYR